LTFPLSLLKILLHNCPQAVTPKAETVCCKAMRENATNHHHSRNRNANQHDFARKQDGLEFQRRLISFCER